jgi:hypothetical protein
LVLVTDPFGPDDPTTLAAAFNHGLAHYKDHHVIDLDVPLERSACPHHRRNARKALSRLRVEEIDEPLTCLDTWCGHYAKLIRRQGTTGVSRFSRQSFERQLAAPGLEAFGAKADTREIVGMILSYCQGKVGYYRLAAYSPRGHAENALYALFRASAARPGPLAESRGRSRRGRPDAIQARLVAAGPAGVSREARRVSSTLCRAVSGSTGDRFLPGVPVQSRLAWRSRGSLAE